MGNSPDLCLLVVLDGILDYPARSTRAPAVSAADVGVRDVKK